TRAIHDDLNRVPRRLGGERARRCVAEEVLRSQVVRDRRQRRRYLAGIALEERAAAAGGCKLGEHRPPLRSKGHWVYQHVAAPDPIDQDGGTGVAVAIAAV